MNFEYNEYNGYIRIQLLRLEIVNNELNMVNQKPKN